MILELAFLEPKQGQSAQLASAIEHAALTVLSRAQGMRHYRLLQGIESPARFILEVTWDSLEAHEHGFRQSPLLQEWRAIVAPLLAAPPVAEHFQVTCESSIFFGPAHAAPLPL